MQGVMEAPKKNLTPAQVRQEAHQRRLRRGGVMFELSLESKSKQDKGRETWRKRRHSLCKSVVQRGDSI